MQCSPSSWTASKWWALHWHCEKKKLHWNFWLLHWNGYNVQQPMEQSETKTELFPSQRVNGRPTLQHVHGAVQTWQSTIIWQTELKKQQTLTWSTGPGSQQITVTGTFYFNFFGGTAKIKLDETDQSHDVVLLLAVKWMMGMHSAYMKKTCSGHPKVIFGNTCILRALPQNYCASVLDPTYCHFLVACLLTFCIFTWHSLSQWQACSFPELCF